MITHYDLFAGVGGFSVAVDEVFQDEPIKHIFCEWEHFPTQVLKKHWPDGEYWGDIADLVAHTSGTGTGVEESGAHPQRRNASSQPERKVVRQGNGPLDAERTRPSFTILTGGFPCQPFSAAGRRRGTSDDRYKWPEMFEVIRNVQPEWVIAENVRGLANWSDGLVLEQICTDMEGEGYEVWPLIIPAVAKNAPHRRDRVWIIAQNSLSQRSRGRGENSRQVLERQKPEVQVERPDSTARNTEDTRSRGQRRQEVRSKQQGRAETVSPSQNKSYDWSTNWPEVAAELCLVDDGLQTQLVRLPDGTKISYPKWRKESLKAGGNAIVPQVAIEILRAIKEQS